MKRSASSLLVGVILLGCSGGTSPATLSTGALPEGQAVRAGSELVSGATLARIVQQQGVAPSAAASAALSDALLAQSARDSFPSSISRSIERAAVARTLLEQLRQAARSGGPPTAQELEDIRHERWLDFDRPAGARTTHAVVLNDKPERDAAAKALAEKLAEALQGAENGDELIKRAQAFPAQGFEIKAEKLQFVTADGRLFQHRDAAGFVALPGGYDTGFSRAALAIEHAGQLSPVTKTSFGYHIILLEERAPEQVVPADQLPTLLVPEVEQRRATRARKELLERLHAATAVQLDRAVDELTAKIKVSP